MYEALRKLAETKKEDLLIDFGKGKTVFYKDGIWQEGYESGDGSFYATADTFIVGKDGPDLSASGGACTIVSLYDKPSKLGCLLHFDVTHMFTERHTMLLGTLIGAFPEFISCKKAYIFVDIGEKTETLRAITKASEAVLGIDLSEVRKVNALLDESIQVWVRNIAISLKNLGISQVKIFTEEEGKNVYLNTRTGLLRCFDNKEKLIFSTGRSSNNKTD